MDQLNIMILLEKLFFKYNLILFAVKKMKLKLNYLFNLSGSNSPQLCCGVVHLQS